MVTCHNFTYHSINRNESIEMDFDIHIQQDWIVQGPDQVSSSLFTNGKSFPGPADHHLTDKWLKFDVQ